MASKKFTTPLTARQIDNLTERGRYPEGSVSCLYLKISPAGSKSWVFMYSRKGKQTEIGLGSWDGRGKAGRVSIPLARKKALTIHDQIAEDKDPLAAKRADAVTFGDCADQLIDSLKGGWRGGKTEAGWRRGLTDLAAPLRDKPVGSITVDQILTVLQPIWLAKQETAVKLRMRLEKVFDFAKVRGLRSGDNPAAWKANLDHLLPKQPKGARGNHAAAAYADLPAFMAKLSGLTAPGVKPLSLTILTAARTADVTKAEWREFDFDAALWTIPGNRTKTGKDHSVPLSTEALDVLRSLPRTEAEIRVFPGIGDSSLLNALKRIDGSLTTHGFRSTFRDWAGDQTNFARETIEECLSHTLGKVERAYRRGEAIEKRRQVLNAWASYVSGEKTVVALKAVAS